MGQMSDFTINTYLDGRDLLEPWKVLMPQGRSV